MDQRQRLEEIEKILEEIVESSSHIPIIVEGRKDKEALRALGASGEIIELNIGYSIFNTCEKISRKHGKVVILTDWDRRGGQLCRLLKEGLVANGVKYNDNIRARLVMLCKKEIKDVESLYKYVNRLREK